VNVRIKLRKMVELVQLMTCFKIDL